MLINGGAAEDTRRRQIHAFVMSGGGSWGALEVGMLKALAARGVHPDMIVGSSIGAVNGAWIASGFGVDEVDEMIDRWSAIKRSDIFPVGPSPWAVLSIVMGLLGWSDHFVSNGALRSLLTRHLKFDRLEDSPIPFYPIAADAITGSDVRLSSGPVVDAVLASTAIPGVFPPVRVEGRLLIDGGVVDNTPISHAVELGADVVWVFPGIASYDQRRAQNHAVGSLVNAWAFSLKRQMETDVSRFKESVEIMAIPAPYTITSTPFEFDKVVELIELGEVTTSFWLEQQAVQSV